MNDRSVLSEDEGSLLLSVMKESFQDRKYGTIETVDLSLTDDTLMGFGYLG